MRVVEKDPGSLNCSILSPRLMPFSPCHPHSPTHLSAQERSLTETQRDLLSGSALLLLHKEPLSELPRLENLLEKSAFSVCQNLTSPNTI